MLARVLLVLFLFVPITEIVLFILIGQAIGVWPTVFGVVGISLIGAMIIRRQGLWLLTEMRQTMGQGQLPARALADAMLITIAGVLMVVPGYFTDAIGLLLLIPQLRHWFYRFLSRRMGLVATAGAAGATPGRPAPGPRVIDLDDEEFRPR